MFPSLLISKSECIHLECKSVFQQRQVWLSFVLSSVNFHYLSRSLVNFPIFLVSQLSSTLLKSKSLWIIHFLDAIFSSLDLHFKSQYSFHHFSFHFFSLVLFSIKILRILKLCYEVVNKFVFISLFLPFI